MITLLSDKAYSLIKKKINSCEGEYLSVRRLSKEINIGYSPVREACNRLSQEGLIKQLPCLKLKKNISQRYLNIVE